ncbi:hypothetical protein QFZ77_007612 [Paenibacillus sp. V4I3]|nr:hypothetical protein [Paenibacillus sp. V4I3]MDQ0885321.1 hypothetical protein [Paenibacillus sp. V4I9]
MVNAYYLYSCLFIDFQHLQSTNLWQIKQKIGILVLPEGNGRETFRSCTVSRIVREDTHEILVFL